MEAKRSLIHQDASEFVGPDPVSENSEEKVMIKKIFALAVLAALATPALAQSINIDFTSLTGSPSAAFGAAAGAPGVGVWNTLASGSGAALLNHAGVATGVGLAGPALGGFSFANPGPIGDQAALMNDLLDGSGTFNFSGLQNGTYDVYTYAWAPDSATFITNVAVTGGSLVEGDAAIGGAWPGTFQAGVTHAHHSVSVTAGTLQIVTSLGSGFASCNGIQLVLVPGPAGLALLGIGGLVGRNRRRS